MAIITTPRAIVKSSALMDIEHLEQCLAHKKLPMLQWLVSLPEWGKRFPYKSLVVPVKGRRQIEISKTYVLSVHLFECIPLFVSTVQDLIWVLIIPYLVSLYMEWDKQDIPCRMKSNLVCLEHQANEEGSVWRRISIVRWKYSDLVL